MGTKIGDNVIVGAGSVVSGVVPSNSVVAGVPAKVICTLDEYYVKRKNNYIRESVVYAKSFKELYNRYPTVKEMGAFSPYIWIEILNPLKKWNKDKSIWG